ncbi:MAG TPA: FAD-dependent oxidoreductase [Woeseiaceae bacterium]|nr:FAD-dependent oxidoreductase [Woeseiaceae bacterium]
MELQKNTVSQTWDRPLVVPGKIPAQADVVVIGGGIVGICTAWFLARQGVGVVVCEKGHIAGEQSGRNWGWVRQQGRDPRELPMIMESLRIWRSFKEQTGEDTGFVEGGCLFSASNDRELAEFAAWVELAKTAGLDTRLITGDELAKLVPGAASHWPGAMYTASDGRAEPHKATPAFARVATKAGAKVLTGCAVRGLDLAAGQVAGVVTEHGRIRTSTVLCAGGAWTSLFCRSLGIDLPQLKVRGTVVRTAPAPNVLDGNLFDTRLGIRRRADGGYTIAPGAILDHPITPDSFRYFFKFLRALTMDWHLVRLSCGRAFIDEWRTPVSWPLDQCSPFEKARVLNPEPNLAAIRCLRKDLAKVFPSLAEIEFVESWAGMIESTPDIVPVIDASRIPGFYIATGFSGHGFGIGPGAGKAIAAMLTGTDSGIDLTPMRLARFFDGSPIRPLSSI